MKKQFSLRSLTLSLIAISLLTIIVIITTTSSKADLPLATRLSGRILLQVEDNGQVWYVSPDNNNQRVQLESSYDVFCLMDSVGLGISNNDLNKYLQDNNNKFPTRLSGKVLLAVEQQGKAYYVNPVNLEAYYLGRPDKAFSVMKKLALGITNTDLNTISVLDKTKMLAECSFIAKLVDRIKEEIKEEGDISEEITVNEISLTTNPIAPMNNFSHIVSVSATLSNPNNIIVKEKGVLYDFTIFSDTNLIPTIDSNEKKLVSTINSDNDVYSLDVTGLIPGSYPFVRAYVITEDDQIIYGNIVNIIGERNLYLPHIPPPSSSISSTPSTPPTPAWACGDPITDDRDSNVYNTVAIGDQCWFQENLAYLPAVHSNAEFGTQGSNQSPGYGVYGYDGSDVDTAKLESNYSTYGVLYNWYAVNQASVCPTGWHVPSDAEWTTLTNWLVSDGEVTAGQEGFALKSATWDGNNSSGFTTLPAGVRLVFGDFSGLGGGAGFWSSSGSDSSSWYRYLKLYLSGVDRVDGDQTIGYSVRCLRTE